MDCAAWIAQRYFERYVVSACDFRKLRPFFLNGYTPPPAPKEIEGRDDIFVVGQYIEISNRFLHDLEATITIAKQCKAVPCYKPSLSKEGLGGL